MLHYPSVCRILMPHQEIITFWNIIIHLFHLFKPLHTFIEEMYFMFSYSDFCLKKSETLLLSTIKEILLLTFPRFRGMFLTHFHWERDSSLKYRNDRFLGIRRKMVWVSQASRSREKSYSFVKFRAWPCKVRTRGTASQWHRSLPGVKVQGRFKDNRPVFSERGWVI